jgi:hypothetical protein
MASMRREDELVAVFQDTFGLLKPLLSALDLSDDEFATFGQFVFGWFDRFARRPGNEHVPLDHLRVPLVSGACRLARNLAESKGVPVPAFSGDPVGVALALGLIAHEKRTEL